MGAKDEIKSTLTAIDFGSLLGAPLTACVEAQAQAAAATTRYVEQVGFTHENSNYDAKTLQFSFTVEGRRKKLIVPLISVVPLPYLNIDNVDINFTTNVALEDGYLVGSISTDNNSTETSNQSSSLKSNIQIKVGLKASTSDMPYGISRILEVLSNSMEVTQQYIEPKEPELSTN